MDDPNKRNYIFGPKHGLGGIVRQYGSREAAGQAIAEVVDAVFHDGSLIA
jgi:hypothetical protein